MTASWRSGLAAPAAQHAQASQCQTNQSQRAWLGDLQWGLGEGVDDVDVCSKSLRLLMDGAESPFQAFVDLSDWLWRTAQKTSGLTPEALVDLLFDYFTTARSIDPQLARETRLAERQARHKVSA